MGWFYLLALAAFWLWQQHVNEINSASPNLDYILHFRKMTQNAGWYFGTLDQRLSLYPWWILPKPNDIVPGAAQGVE